jgi:hypothetical protein
MCKLLFCQICSQRKALVLSKLYSSRVMLHCHTFYNIESIISDWFKWHLQADTVPSYPIVDSLPSNNGCLLLAMQILDQDYYNLSYTHLMGIKYWGGILIMGYFHDLHNRILNKYKKNKNKSL